MDIVAPLAGAWIEILTVMSLSLVLVVAPLAGAWIEIKLDATTKTLFIIAPLVGAGVEMTQQHLESETGSCRSPRGSVD